MATTLQNRSNDSNLVAIRNTTQEYTDNLKFRAEELALKEFPLKLVQLNDILESPIFKDRNSDDIHQDLNISESLAYQVNGLDESRPAKRKKRNNSENNSVLAHGIIPINKHVEDVIKIIKPYLKKLAEDSMLIKVWISILIPKIEDGNNFGVSIQESILAVVQSVEHDTHTYIEHISNYYVARAKLISKVYKYPFIEDYRYAVQEVDEKQFLSLYMILTDIRNDYYTLHDVIVKNLEKIKRPRTTDAGESLY